MFIPHRSKRILASLLFVLVLFPTGCGPAGFKEPITKFRDSSAVVIASTKIYLGELNKVERGNYILEKASERGQIKLDELEAVQVFSKEGLQARLDALDQLAAYGELLLKLANSDAPEKITAEATNLGEAIKKLSGTVSGFAGADDANFKAAVDPVAKIIGTIVESIVQKKISDALSKAINKGEEPINALLEAIRSDMQVAYERKKSFFSNTRVILIDDYKNALDKGADSERLRTLAERIRTHEDRWEELGSANPSEAIDAMKKAHTALVKYAKSSHKVTDLASLVDAMEVFAARAKSIGQSIQALREI
jgi:hypothetical protein